MKNKTYQCEACHGIFEVEWTDAEAQEEMRTNFGDIPEEKCAVICDDCYQLFMKCFN
jgi:rubredoxin